MSFPSTLKPTDKLEQKQINLNGKAVTILFIYCRKKGSKQQKEIIDEFTRYSIERHYWRAFKEK